MASTGNTLKTKVTGIEMFRKIVVEAKEGDRVGLLLGRISKNDVARGDIIYR